MPSYECGSCRDAKMIYVVQKLARQLHCQEDPCAILSSVTTGI